MTDVTGFGLLGHLLEVCESSNVSAEVDFSQIPVISGIERYIDQKAIPGGTDRNFDSYGYKVSPMSDLQKAILCDPQTSGGLLIAVDPEQKSEFLEILRIRGLNLKSFGRIISQGEPVVDVK